MAAPRSSAGSTSLRSAAPNAKSVPKGLAYDHDFSFSFPAAASDALPDGGLTSSLELPDPDGASSSSTITSAAQAQDDAVAAPADGEAPLPQHIDLVLRGAGGLSPLAKRLVAALAEAAAADLTLTATSRYLRRAAFWRKVRVGVLAATVAAVAAIDVALMVALVSRRGSAHNHSHVLVLPPT